MRTLGLHEVLLAREDVGALPWRPFAHGVTYKEVWSGEGRGAHAGCLKLEPGAHVPRHIHPDASHHMWVIEGSCTIDGRTFRAGSYGFAPRATEHAIDAVGDEGCTIFYVFVPDPFHTEMGHIYEPSHPEGWAPPDDEC